MKKSNKSKTNFSWLSDSPVIPPLQRLASFNASAIVLSYDVYKHEVKALLRRLSRNSYRYYESHREIIESFLVSGPKPEVVCNRLQWSLT